MMDIKKECRNIETKLGVDETLRSTINKNEADMVFSYDSINAANNYSII